MTGLQCKNSIGHSFQVITNLIKIRTDERDTIMCLPPSDLCLAKDSQLIYKGKPHKMLFSWVKSDQMADPFR